MPSSCFEVGWRGARPDPLASASGSTWPEPPPGRPETDPAPPPAQPGDERVPSGAEATLAGAGGGRVGRMAHREPVSRCGGGAEEAAGWRGADSLRAQTCCLLLLAGLRQSEGGVGAARGMLRLWPGTVGHCHGLAKEPGGRSSWTEFWEGEKHSAQVGRPGLGCPASLTFPGRPRCTTGPFAHLPGSPVTA